MVISVQARMGVHECVTHKLIDPFQVLYDKVLDFKSHPILTWFYFFVFFRKGPTSLSTSSQYCWCPTDPIKSQVHKIVPLLWLLFLWRNSGYYILTVHFAVMVHFPHRPTLWRSPLQVRPLPWGCRDSGRIGNLNNLKFIMHGTQG